MNVLGHFKTITLHRLIVCKGCFKIGLYRQGLTHDLSKYMPTEFLNGIRYYQGYRSPNNAEREDKGYSAAWLHHKGRNRHHFEYWIDYVGEGHNHKAVMMPMRMPDNYIAEMFVDRVSASKVYLGDAYKDNSAYLYYRNGDITDLLHPYTRILLETWLIMLARRGEDYTFAWIRRFLKEPEKRREEIVSHMIHGNITKEEMFAKPVFPGMRK